MKERAWALGPRQRRIPAAEGKGMHWVSEPRTAERGIWKGGSLPVPGPYETQAQCRVEWHWPQQVEAETMGRQKWRLRLLPMRITGLACCLVQQGDSRATASTGQGWGLGEKDHESAQRGDQCSRKDESLQLDTCL